MTKGLVPLTVLLALVLASASCMKQNPTLPDGAWWMAQSPLTERCYEFTHYNSRSLAMSEIPCREYDAYMRTQAEVTK